MALIIAVLMRDGIRGWCRVGFGASTSIVDAITMIRIMRILRSIVRRPIDGFAMECGTTLRRSMGRWTRDDTRRYVGSRSITGPSGP